MPVAAAVRRRGRVKIGPDGGEEVRGSGLPGGEATDATGSAIAAEPAHCEVLVAGGACWATAVAAAEA